jgi:serine/threonine protein phosphatase 1
VQLRWTGWEFIFLRGNHDQAVLQFAADANFYRSWRDFGGGETLRSYGVKPPLFDKEEAFAEAQRDFMTKCPPRHFEFFRSLKYLDIVGDYAFVHAGLRPGLALDRQSPEDLLWIRDEFLNYDGPFEKMVVHGHSPSSEPVRRSNRIGVDTGAYATDCLTAAVLVGENCTFLNARPVAEAV